MLGAAFRQAELDYLNAKSEFSLAFEHTRSADQFEELCQLGEDLLGERTWGNVNLSLNRERHS